VCLSLIKVTTVVGDEADGARPVKTQRCALFFLHIGEPFNALLMPEAEVITAMETCDKSCCVPSGTTGEYVFLKELALDTSLGQVIEQRTTGHSPTNDHPCPGVVAIGIGTDASGS
jgi:hypothetical protein